MRRTELIIKTQNVSQTTKMYGKCKV